MKQILKIKIILIIFVPIFCFCLLFIYLITALGVSLGNTLNNQNIAEIKANNSVINSSLYSNIYMKLVTDHLINDGYVPLERLVFYLQRTNNILDTSTLSYEIWEKAYLENINIEYKQVIPIKTICKKIDADINLPEYTIQSGTNSRGIYIEVLDLCNINGINITNSDLYSEDYYILPYTFPLKDYNFVVTSYLFEQRDVNLSLNKEELLKTNYHNGWDFAVPLNTEIYSICDGVFNQIVFTQNNNLPFNLSGNRLGNYLKITCNDGNIAIYHHIKFDSNYRYKIGNKVEKGTLIANVSTTGISTGYHLHLGLNDSQGNNIDVLQYINLLEFTS